MARLLHISDLHLDRAFASMGCQGELARRRRQGLRDALRRAGEVAQERQCDAICIGGDLYEHDRAGADTQRFLLDTFASWQPLPILVAPGNHDPLVPGSLYSRSAWPDNVHIFSEPQLTPIEIADLTIWGLGHREPAWQGDPLDIATIDRAGVHIALFHGAEMGSRPDGKSIHGPFRAADIRERGFSAALCGHYHKRRLDDALGLVYPGTPEPLSFDDTGRRGPVIVEVDSSGAVSFEAIDINAWNALDLTCDVSGAASPDAVSDNALQLLQAAAALDPSRTLARITLRGDVAAAVAVDAFTIQDQLRDRAGLAGVRVRDQTRATIDIESAASERTARGAFARRALEAIDNATDDQERAVIDDALHYGLMALSGAEVGLR